ncbi:hypothetical protein RJT34_13812 [Clitoria ternatea]|uniref:Uncharacterized protein n=1 Tax=Clitoria ternatea TaxID=43366 RepID=A0AAN9PKI5_CLITE
MKRQWYKLEQPCVGTETVPWTDGFERFRPLKREAVSVEVASGPSSAFWSIFSICPLLKLFSSSFALVEVGVSEAVEVLKGNSISFNFS